MGEQGLPAVAHHVDAGHAGEGGHPRPTRPGRARQSDDEARRRRAPAIVVRPHVAFAIAGVGFLALAIGGAAVIGPGLLLFAVPGLALIATQRKCVQVDSTTIRRRGLLGWYGPYRLDDVSALRVRRMRSSSGLRRSPLVAPLVLRIWVLDDQIVHMTVVLWSGWAGLARFVGSVESVDVDTRSRKRIAEHTR